MRYIFFLLVLVSLCNCKKVTEISKSEHGKPDVSERRDNDSDSDVDDSDSDISDEDSDDVDVPYVPRLVDASESDDGEVYLIVPYDEVTQEMIDVATQTSFATLRHSIEGEDVVLLSWVIERPDELLGWDEYTHQEILEVLQEREWNICYGLTPEECR